jgi:hypothetical protein
MIRLMDAEGIEEDLAHGLIAYTKGAKSVRPVLVVSRDGCMRAGAEQQGFRRRSSSLDDFMEEEYEQQGRS